MATLFVPGSYATIAAALAAAAPGDTIEIASGYGAETVTVGVNNVTFSAPGDVAGIILNAGVGVADILTSGASNFQINGNTGANLLVGNAGANVLNGGDGDDILRGGAGADMLNGGNGRDWASYRFAAAGVRADLSNSATNTGDAAGDTYTSIENLNGSAFDDTLVGDANNNILYGGAGADSLIGGSGSDVADYWSATAGVRADLSNSATNTGDAAGDTYSSIERIRGSDFDDILVGDNNNNELTGNIGADTLSGGGGSDWAVYWNSTVGIRADLSNSATNTGDAAGDTYLSIENLSGSDFGDILVGDGGNNILNGHLGADTLDGGSGSDWASYINSAAGIRADLSNAATNTGEAAGDSYISIENLLGGSFGDTLVGDSGNNSLDGYDGADTLIGGAGNDSLFGGAGIDTFDGGDGTGDYIGSYYNLVAGVHVTFTGRYSGAYIDVLGNTETFTNIEAIGGTSFADSFIAGAGDQQFYLYGGNDAVSGGDGYDFLAMTSSSGGGWNSATNPTTGAVVNFIAGTITGGYAGTIVTISGIERVRGTNFIDTFYGNDVYASFQGMGGVDVYIGGTSLNDQIDFRADANAGGTAGVTVDIAAGTATDGFGNAETMSGVESINGTNFVDVIYGDTIANVLFGAGGNDTLDGRDGDDSLSGGNGVDSLIGGSGLDWTTNHDDVYYNDGTAGVTVNLSTQTQIDAWGNADTLSSIENAAGTQLVDKFVGNSADNIFRGYAGNDVIDGASGIDTLQAYSSGVFEARSSESGVYIQGTQGWVVDVAAGTVIDQFGNTDSITRIERFSATMLVDMLTGAAGTQYFQGLGGNDVIDGGADEDWVEYGRDASFGGIAGIFVNLATGVATDGFGNTDSLTGIENVSGTAQIDTLTGNGVVNKLYGLAGNDTLDGGIGADWLYGGINDDLYIVDNASDRTYELAGEGYDIAETSVTYQLFSGYEIELLRTNNAAGVAAINLIGNSFGQQIEGNAGVNDLNGALGADVLVGFGGNDVYRVDNIGDQTIEAVGGGSDKVVAASTYSLLAGQEIEWLAAANSASVTAQNLTGNEFGQRIDGSAGANRINGLGGADQMIGLGGDDIYTVDNAGDSVVETAGGGNDLVQVSTSWVVSANREIETITTTASGGTTAINITGNTLGQTIRGNNGANTIDGGAGNDTLTGYAGLDIFVFSTALNATTNLDTITDYNVANDQIRLKATVFTQAGAAGTLAASAFVIGAAAADASDRIIYDNATGGLYYDSDGTGAATQVQFAQLATGLALTNNEFTIF